MEPISLGTVVVSIILIAIVGSVVYSMVRKKRAGKSILCSCGEGSCSCSGTCKLASATCEKMLDIK